MPLTPSDKDRSMRRSRPTLAVRASLTLVALAAGAALLAPATGLAAPSPTAKSWSPRLAYVLTTGETLDAVAQRLHLDASGRKRLRDLGWKLYMQQRRMQAVSDAIVGNDALSLEQKRTIIASSGYNQGLESAEASVATQISAALGVPSQKLNATVEAVWQADAALHIKESLAAPTGLNNSTHPGAFRVYGTWFETTEGVALPDMFLKFANLHWSNSGDTARTAGYPSTTYGVSLYWDGKFRTISGAQRSNTPKPAKSVYAKVLDVGPWNHDDNWWDSYSDLTRPRRINLKGWKTSDGVYHYIDGQRNLVGKAHLPFGVPEAQAAYFNYYARPSKIPVGGTTDFDWKSAKGYGGQWSGADQFGRQVLNPAGVDLGTVPARALGLENNEWIEVTPLWESRLDLTSAVKVTPGPYFTGQRVTFGYTAKNLGTLSGAWSYARFALPKTGGWVFSPYAGAFTLSPGRTKTFSQTMTLGTAGKLTGKPQSYRAGSWTDIGARTVTLSISKRTVDRVAGRTVYDTSIAQSKQAYPATSTAVVLARGGDYAEAFPGAALADAEKGPLLLVPSTITTALSGELKRLAPKRIFVLGNGSHISTATANKLASYVPKATLTRLAGGSPYATARLVAWQVAHDTGKPIPNRTAIIVNAASTQDQLAAAYLSAAKHWPMLLTMPGYLPGDSYRTISALGITSAVVVGGGTKVSSSVTRRLASLGCAVRRIGGTDQYGTSALLADFAKSRGLGYSFVGLSAGGDYADGVGGAVLTAKRGGVMLLTPGGSLWWAAKSRLAAARTVTSHLQAFGSTPLLYPATLSAAEDALR
jgi:putative cell wall-binding protein